MTDCDALAPLIAERASGPLAGADELRVAAHLATCEACRGRAARLAALLADARAPGPSELEEREAASLPRRAVTAARHAGRGGSGRRWALGVVGAATAAAAVAVVTGPLHLWQRPVAPAVQLAAGDGSAAAADADAIAAAAWDAADVTESDIDLE